jgi:hypothetical protein
MLEVRERNGVQAGSIAQRHHATGFRGAGRLPMRHQMAGSDQTAKGQKQVVNLNLPVRRTAEQINLHIGATAPILKLEAMSLARKGKIK